MLIKIILIAFALFALSKAIIKFKKKEITFFSFSCWLLFWLAVATIVFVPEITNYLAYLAGVGRGADLVVYLSIVLLFYLIFKILGKLQTLNSQISKIVEFLAIKDKKEK